MNICGREIHLWFICDEEINDPYLLSQYYNVLSKEELKQQRRFYFEKHRHQYLITRAMVRTVLSQYESRVSPEEWQFKYNNYGKPFISDDVLETQLRFNISHSDKMILMAVTVDQEIGIDIEYLARKGENVEIADKFFSAVEVRQLRALPVEMQKARFFDLWTLKEAYIKACGMGLSIPLDQFSFSFSPEGAIAVSFEPERNDQSDLWTFWQISPGDSHKVAVAIKDSKLNQQYSLSMRKIVPCSEVVEVSYPIFRKSRFN